MVNIKLPDGSVMKMEDGVNGYDVAAKISSGLAKAALAVKVNDKLQDLTTPITTDATVTVITAKDKDGKETKIDIDNPREDKIYRTVVNDYYAMGKDNLTMLDKIDWAEKIYDFDFTRCVKDHFKKDKTPVEIKDDGRIKIINSNSQTKTAS